MAIRDYLYPALGAAFAVAGLDKLANQRGYRRLFRHWGWSVDTMRLVGAGEVAGGLLIMPASTRRLGGALLTASSAAVLAAELRANDTSLASMRLPLLAAALAALIAPRASGRRS